MNKFVLIEGVEDILSDITPDATPEPSGDEGLEITSSQFMGESQYRYKVPTMDSVQKVQMTASETWDGLEYYPDEVYDYKTDGGEGHGEKLKPTIEESVNGDDSKVEHSIPKESPPEDKETFPSDHYTGYADQFIQFMNENPTTYHTITYFKSLLTNNGFTELNPKLPISNLKPGFYYTARDDLSIVAFVLGGKWNPEIGTCFVGTHVDALAIKVNHPKSKSQKDGYQRLGVSPYSGSMNALWLDRDLGVAGSVLVRKNGKVSRELVSSAPHAIATIPKLAEHFGPVSLTPYNKETKMVPIAGLGNEDKFTSYVANLAGAKEADIIQSDLDLFDVQPATIGGIDNSMIYSSALDDRLCSFAAIYALVEFSQRFQSIDVEEFDGFVGTYCANHEEIGSNSRTGAYSGQLRHVIESVAGSTERSAQAFANTVIISSDVTHAVNPNYSNIYLDGHKPTINTGPTIKLDSNMHVLSDSSGWRFAQEIVDRHCKSKLQTFHIRNDSRSGGTIGPIMAHANTGINGARLVVDIGLPILSMHSIRSICGVKDVAFGVEFYKAIFEYWKQQVDELDV